MGLRNAHDTYLSSGCLLCGRHYAKCFVCNCLILSPQGTCDIEIITCSISQMKKQRFKGEVTCSVNEW